MKNNNLNLRIEKVCAKLLTNWIKSPKLQNAAGNVEIDKLKNSIMLVSATNH